MGSPSSHRGWLLRGLVRALLRQEERPIGGSLVPRIGDFRGVEAGFAKLGRDDIPRAGKQRQEP